MQVKDLIVTGDARILGDLYAKFFVTQATAPSNTNLLWIDTSNGGLKYWNGSAWTQFTTIAVWG